MKLSWKYKSYLESLDKQILLEIIIKNAEHYNKASRSFYGSLDKQTLHKILTKNAEHLNEASAWTSKSCLIS